MISLFSCWASWSSTRWPAQRGLRNTVRCRPPTPSAAALVASPSRLARPPAKALAKHWQSIGKVIWMRHRACGWHAACCFCRFLQASDETQAETCDKKEQEITRRNKKKIQSRNMDGGEFEFKCPWLKIAKSSFVLYLDAFDQDLRVRWWKLPDRHLGNNSAASVVILKPPRMIGPLLYLAPEFIWIKYIIF